MSFSTEIKNEVCSLKLSRVENISFLSGFVRNNKLEDVNKISLVTENPKIIRYLYNLFKEIYGVSPLIEKGKSNNFNKNTYYNLVIDNNANFILKDIMVIDENNKILDKPKSYITDTEDLKRAYLRGVFLACGSINDPKKLGYHMEFFIDNKSEASFVSNILNDFYFKNSIFFRQCRTNNVRHRLFDTLKAFNHIYFFNLKSHCKIHNQSKCKCQQSRKNE